MKLFEEKHVCASAPSTTVTPSTGREVELTGSHGADACEIDVRVDRSEYGAQRYEHYENDGPDEHFFYSSPERTKSTYELKRFYFLLGRDDVTQSNRAIVVITSRVAAATISAGRTVAVD